MVSLDSDRKRIISWKKDGSVRLCDVESEQLLVQLGEATTGWKVGFLRGGRVAVVVSREGAVMMEIWHVDRLRKKSIIMTRKMTKRGMSRIDADALFP